MTQRTVEVMATYKTVDGRHRIGVQGEVVDVHPDFLERFDKYNKAQVAEPAPVAAPEPTPEPVDDDKPARTRRTGQRKDS